MARFVPGHPIAGLEQSGVEAATGDLFKDHKVILTPTRDTDPKAVAQIGALWRTTGAQLMNMSPERHDRLLALTSHLPHMLAYALVNLLAGQAKMMTSVLIWLLEVFMTSLELHPAIL